MVIWIIGMSGSGKTTLGQSMVELMKPAHPETIFIDGDIFREIMDNDLGHSIEDRWTNAQRISRFCRYLGSQNINVVCAILSIFHDSQEWNRKNISNYKEIYLEVSMNTLRQRDPRGLYAETSQFNQGDVVGVDIDFKPPFAPDLVINNDADTASMELMARQALAEFEVNLVNGYRYSANNLLEHPEKYEYTEFQGQEFLDSYSQNRDQTIRVLRERVRKLESSYGSESESHPWTEELGLPQAAGGFLNKELPISDVGIEKNGELATRRFLTKLITAAISDDEDPDIDLLLRLVQRFEISKVIYTTYKLPSLRRTASPVAEFLDIGLFATTLAILSRQVTPEQRLIMFNALLKLNDILESISEKLSTPAEQYLALTAMKHEQEIYHSLRSQVLA